MNERKTALEIIYKTITDSSYSNLLMRSSLNDEDANIAFITNLVYGVLENYESLKYQLGSLYESTSKLNEIILIMSLYERFILKKEDYITINEYVKLAKNEYDKSFINAILHKITNYTVPDNDSARHNLPEWIYNLLKKQYSEEEFNLILDNYSHRKSIYYHINHNKFTFDQLNKFKITQLNNDFFISDENLIKTDEFSDGMFYIQDINSSKIIENLDLKKEDKFLDACSAPGSKLFNALQYIDDNNAYANDINDTRLNLIKNKATILGYENVHYSCFDARKLSSKINMKFNKILLDVPCSGIGVISRKPDIKFHLIDKTLDNVQLIQKDILEDCSKLLEINGLLCYSTCTLNKKENEKQVNSFINNHSDFIKIKEETIFDNRGDMFYYCVLKRII